MHALEQTAWVWMVLLKESGNVVGMSTPCLDEERTTELQQQSVRQTDVVRRISTLHVPVSQYLHSTTHNFEHNFVALEASRPVAAA